MAQATQIATSKAYGLSMATPHSIERTPPKAGAVTVPSISKKDIAKAARYTLVAMDSQSVGRLALRYRHVGTDDNRVIAYAIGKECRYGPRFAAMDRFSQAFVVFHETMHHVLGHIPQGALLYKRLGKRFSFKLFNIACDAQINHAAKSLNQVDPKSVRPRSDKNDMIVYGVHRCQELGIVEWDDICREMREMGRKYGIDVNPAFSAEIRTLTAVQIYHALHAMIRKVADIRRSEARKQDWDDLVAAIGSLTDAAISRPDDLLVTSPLELGPVDLHDALAGVARTYAVSAEPLDHAGSGHVALDAWQEVATAISALVVTAKADPAHAFTQDPVRRARTLWNDLAAIANTFRKKDDDSKSDNDNETSSPDDEDSLIDALADDLNAHDDLREAIENASESNEEQIIGDIRSAEETLKRHRAGVGSGDALFNVAIGSGLTRTPWREAMRRLASTALVSRLSIDPLRPSRRSISAAYEAGRMTRVPRGVAQVVTMTPRIRRRVDAKRCVFILDTSGSMFADRKLMEQCLREAWTICKRVNTVMTIIFADAKVVDVIDIGEAYDLIRTMEPRGGGGTDFRDAIRKAEELNPDLIIYVTDLMGTFPEKAPSKPIIWAFPPEYADQKTPFGQRLQLAA